MRRGRTLLTVALLACLGLPTVADAAQTVKLHASLTPERLGHGTTIGFGFRITSRGRGAPAPLRQVEVSYPNDLGIALSGIGLATCTSERLEESGPEGCPTESLMGYGTAETEIPIGSEILHEKAHLTLLRAPVQDGRLAMLFYADGTTPVSAQVVLPGLILPTPPPYGGRIDVSVPLIPSLPGAPEVSLTQLQTTVGPEHLTYYERIGRRLFAYQPQGILLPDTCPRSGFPFAATFAFQDGTRAHAETHVPCPRSR